MKNNNIPCCMSTGKIWKCKVKKKNDKMKIITIIILITMVTIISGCKQKETSQDIIHFPINNDSKSINHNETYYSNSSNNTVGTFIFWNEEDDKTRVSTRLTRLTYWVDKEYDMFEVRELYSENYTLYSIRLNWNHCKRINNITFECKIKKN